MRTSLPAAKSTAPASQPGAAAGGAAVGGAAPAGAAAAPTTAEILALASTHCFATWHRTFLLIWRTAAPAEAVAQLRGVLSQFISASPTPASFLVIIERNVAIPDEASRREFATLSRDVIPRLIKAVAVPEGGTLRLSLVRGITTALTFILPHRVPYEFCVSIPAALVALAPVLDDAPGGATALGQALAELRGRLGTMA